MDRLQLLIFSKDEFLIETLKEKTNCHVFAINIDEAGGGRYLPMDSEINPADISSTKNRKEPLYVDGNSKKLDAYDHSENFKLKQKTGAEYGTYIPNLEKYVNYFIHTIPNYEIVIFDGIEKFILDELLKTIDFSSKLIINLNSYQFDGICNINLPFSLGKLLQKIDNYSDYYGKNFIKCHGGLINIKNSSYNRGNVTVRLTNRETAFLEVLASGGKTKNELLKNVWKQKNIVANGADCDSKVIDTMLYNLRQKLAKKGIDNFIKVGGGIYKIDG